MSGISQTSLRALGCLRLRSRARHEILHISRPTASSRQHAQLASKIENEEFDDDDIEDGVERGSYGARSQEIHGREFVKRHLQELDRARRAELADTKRNREPSSSPTTRDGVEPSGSRYFREQTSKPENPVSRRQAAVHSPKSLRSRRIPRSTRSTLSEAVTAATPDTSPKDVESLARELRRILTSTSALAKPWGALERALAHHREHISASSASTFNALLAYAAGISNYHCMRKILRDMQRQNVQWNEETRKIITKVTLRGAGGGALREKSYEVDDASTANEMTKPNTRRTLPKHGGIDNSLSGLTQRVEASRFSISESERSILLNGGYWKSEKSPRQKADAEGDSPIDTEAGSAQSPSSRISVLQGALSPAEARSHLPKLDKQLSPTLFLAFLRYILACNPQPPSLAESYMALLALKRKEQMITSEHVRHLAHLYLHPSLYASFRPFWVVREMRRLTRDGSIHFNPTSETLEKALLSFRMRRNRHRRAVELVEYFKRKWGETIVSIKCWRLVGRYALELKNQELQQFAIEGGNEALAQQIKRTKTTWHSQSAADIGTPAAATDDELFPRYGLERRKWGRVRQAIVRSQSRARRKAEDVQATSQETAE